MLTFYQERIANESYLRTALERVSLQEMGRLIGYRLRPGVAAETWLAFTLETPPAPPPKLSPEPGSFVTGVPAQVSIEIGTKVQSVPGPDEKPQTFETVERLDAARPAWNAIRPWLAETRRPDKGDTVMYLAGQRNNLKPGDALLIVGDAFNPGTNDSNCDFRFIDSVELQSDFDRTKITWQAGLSGVTAAAELEGLCAAQAGRALRPQRADVEVDVDGLPQQLSEREWRAGVARLHDLADGLGPGRRFH